MDYLIADGHHVPEGSDAFYAERIVRLPNGYICYGPPDYAPKVGPLPFERNGFITFGCFNNPAKINDSVLAAWAEILQTVPASRLILKYRNMDAPSNRKRIVDQFGLVGIEESRLILEKCSPHSDLLARYNDIDIAMDTFPYSGGLTTCEALWMGVPVITKPGETFASRHSLSHLSTVGLPQLVSDDGHDYVGKAAALAEDIPQLAALRAELRDRIAKSPLCDGKKFAVDFGSLMRRIWRDWCATQKGSGTPAA